MSKFVSSLVQRLSSSDVKVTENCKYWKPILFNLPKEEKVCDVPSSQNSEKSCSKDYNSIKPLNINGFIVGRALNQYFIQKRISETSNSTLWRCFDVVKNEFFCIKLFYITACRKERSVRFFRDDTEVITVLDKVIDEILYHSSLQNCSGVCKVKEIIVDLEGDVMYFIMSYHPSQLMYYDFENNSYCVPYFEGTSSKYLYKEHSAKKIFRQIAHTIQYLHENGMIHKDIKPDNLLLSSVESEMFECFEPFEETLYNYNSEDYFDKDSPKEDLERLLSKLKELKYTEILSFTVDKIKGCMPKDFATLGFPYNFSTDFDFFFTLWEDCEVVVDSNNWTNEKDMYKVGENSLFFASELAKKSELNSTSLMYYFVINPTSLPYRVNRNFISENLEEPVKMSVHEDEKDQLVVITDFGVTSLAEEESGNLVIFDSEGTISFTSPESLRYIDGSIPGVERDVFSLGVTLYCMIYGKLPYSGNNSIEMLINVLENPLVFHPFRKISEDLHQLLNEMLHKEHDKRIKLKEILSHPWLNS